MWGRVACKYAALERSFLAIAAIPFIYYLIAIYSSWRYFRQPASAPEPSFTPPVSILKPIRGLDPDAVRKSRQLLPPGLSRIRNCFLRRSRRRGGSVGSGQAHRDFPECRIRVLYGSGRVATNDKVAKLARLVSEAAYEVVVISDSDVRVRPDYLRT